ncbi:MAG TPA: hypothetical protein VK986_19650, partial [Tepidisphaeraceae bacterium]|nr:hypothetical protein [Tepidisphaeraceae bacterium]
AFTVMSEPPAVAAMWAGVWILSTTRAGEDATRRRVKIAAAAVLFLAAAATRDAVIVLIPGFLLLLPGAIRPGFVFAIGGVIVGLITVGAMLPYKAMHGKLGNGAYAYAVLIPLAVGLAVLLWKRRDLVTRAFDKLRLPESRTETYGQVALVVVLMGAWLGLYRYPPSFLARSVVTRQLAATMPAGTNPSTLPTADQTAAMAAISTGEGDDDTATGEGRYKAKWLYGVKRDWHLVTDPPLLAGRWITEGLAMPSVAVFESTMQAVASVGKAVGFVAFALSAVGLVVLLLRGHWWLMGPALYFAAIWLQWGTRIKPRYMVPVAPVLFVLLFAGVAALLAGRRARVANDPAATPGGRNWLIALAGLVIAANAYPWWVEFRVRHRLYDPAGGIAATAGQPRDFYDVARHGAFARLVDIAAYLQKNASPQEDVWMNDGAHRRIAYFLSGRPIQVREIPIRDWAEWIGNVSEADKGSKRQKAIRDFRRQVPANHRYIIVYADRPAGKEVGWPGWHLPLAPDAAPVVWWKLYARETPGSNKWVEVNVPRADRTFVRAVPGAGI